MKDYQARVVLEKEALYGKVCKLLEFINSNEFYAVDEYEKRRLESQFTYMLDYLDVLRIRIGAFESP